MHLALYRKYRSKTFDEVCGQDHITSVLKYQAETGRVSHAYLFCGSRGTGKTSCAKILAKAVNCENPQNGNPCGKCEACLSIDRGSAVDVVEMDAASETGVDYIRSIKEEVQYPPAILKKRVYIIDEIHMLSESAFNALLKTLEEPPEHVIFILATTELHKMPTTVVSRCQRFDFRRLSVIVLCDRLMYIAENEGIKLDAEAAKLIAKQAQGGMRDAISLFELCSGGGADVTEARVYDILGISGYETAADTALKIATGDVGGLFDTISSVSASSKDISVFWQELTSFYRDMLIAKYSNDAKEYLDLTDNDLAILQNAASKFTLPQLFRHSKVLDDALRDMNAMPQSKRITAEFALIKMCDETLDTSPEALLERIEALESKVLSGVDVAGGGGASKTQKTIVGEEKNPFETGDRRTLENEDSKASKKSISFFEPMPETEPNDSDVKGESGSSEFIKLRDTSEAVQIISKTDVMCGMLVSEAAVEVSTDSSVIRITTENGFATAYFTEKVCKDVSDAFLAAKITDRQASVQVVLKNNAKGRAYDVLFDD